MPLEPWAAEVVFFLLPFTILAILALGLNLQWGIAGQFNGGVAGFFAVGAYAAGILLTEPALRNPTTGLAQHLGGFSQPFAIGVAGAFVLALLAGFLVATVTLNLREDYLAMATLALAEAFRVVLLNAKTITAGPDGITSIPRPTDGIIPVPPADPLADPLEAFQLNAALLALFFLVILVVLLLVLESLRRSPWGRALRAIREDESAAEVLGKDTFLLKLQAFSLGCGIMGIAGALHAVNSRYISPDQFAPFATFALYAMVLLGGAGNHLGAVVGAAVFYFTDWASVRLKDAFPDIKEEIPYYRLIVIGLLLILLVMLRPQGLLPERKYVPRRR